MRPAHVGLSAAWPRRCSRWAWATASASRSMADKSTGETVRAHVRLHRAGDGVRLCRPVTLLGEHHRRLRVRVLRREAGIWPSCRRSWESKLEPVYPYRKDTGSQAWQNQSSGTQLASLRSAPPRSASQSRSVIIPVFPGTNCEYDTARAFARAGADPEMLVIRNLTPADVTASCEGPGQAPSAKARSSCCPAASPAATSRTAAPSSSPRSSAAPPSPRPCASLLQKRDGLMLGICNGFQALIKLGLVPYGDIREITARMTRP